MKAPYKRREWTDEEQAELWKLKCAGIVISEIAIRLGRNPSSCAGRISRTDENGCYISLATGNIMIWNPALDEIVKKMRDEGFGPTAIAEHLGIKASQVGSRFRELDGRMAVDKGAKSAGPHSPAIRTCMMCGSEFPSAHAGNRRCLRCRKLLSSHSDSPYNPGICGSI